VGGRPGSAFQGLKATSSPGSCMLHSHRRVSPISRFAANRDRDSRSRPNRESGIPCFPIPANSDGNRGPGFLPRFPAKSGLGGTGIQVGDFRRVCFRVCSRADLGYHDWSRIGPAAGDSETGHGPGEADFGVTGTVPGLRLEVSFFSSSARAAGPPDGLYWQARLGGAYGPPFRQ